VYNVAAFVDTNILLYALSSVDQQQKEKVLIAQSLIQELTHNGNLILSAQFPSEFVSVSSRKGTPPLSLQKVADVVTELSRNTVIPIEASLILLALHRVQQSRISYWDALIVEAAIRSGATILYTEDMHHGMRCGTLELRNPFLL
jgi:predicted nucleic acid-binding protein